MAVLLVDTALALIFVGFVSLIRPLRFLRVRTRRTAAVLAAAGLALVLAGLFLPVSPPHLEGPRMALDEIVPAYQFGEAHEIRIQAPPERVFAAVEAVTAREIRFFRLLTWLRRFGQRLPPSIQHVPDGMPVLDAALAGGGLLLADVPPGEIVFGLLVIGRERLPRVLTADAFTQATGPGFVRAAMNFLVVSDGDGGSLVTTETRVHATDARSERRFAVYWRIIRPGSGLIRRMWLRAIQVRAERGPQS